MKGGAQTVTTQPDAATQQYVNQMRQLALGYTMPGGGAAPGAPGAQGGSFWDRVRGGMFGSGASSVGAPIRSQLPPEILAAQQQYGQFANAGQLGLGALTGQAGAQSQFMNPYLSAMNPVFQQLREQSLSAVDDRATQAGAYGGSRQGVARGVALGDVANTQAGFNYQGFQDAMNRAAQAANLGFGAIGAGAFLPQQYQSGQLGLLQQAIGPYGQTQTQPGPDPWSQLLGTGLTVGGFLVGGPAGGYAGSQVGR